MSAWWGAAAAYAVVLAAAITLRRVARRPTRVEWTASSRTGSLERARGWGERLVVARHREEAMAALLDEIASVTRAGTSLAAALRELASARTSARELGSVIARVDRGSTLAAALEHWRDTATDAPSRLTATVLTHVAALGGTDARPLEAVADSLRERVAVRGELRTQAAQARASAVVLSVLPPAFLVVVTAIDPDVAEVLLQTSLGWSCLVAGLLLDVTGALWMARIVRGAEA
jgi:tight adherence protein B